MSRIVPNLNESVIVRSAAAEVIGRAPTTIRLLADSSSTGGALSTQRVSLIGGADGARPHHQADSAELFYMSCLRRRSVGGGTDCGGGLVGSSLCGGFGQRP